MCELILAHIGDAFGFFLKPGVTLPVLLLLLDFLLVLTGVAHA